MKVRIAQPYHDKEIEDSVLYVWRSGCLLPGPIVESSEEVVAEYLDVNNAVAVSSGTTALHLSLLTLDIKPRQEVIAIPFSFAAAANRQTLKN